MPLYIGYESISDSEETYCGRAFLESIVLYVQENLTPGQVHELDILADYVASNLTPDQVFETQELETWAKENGFEEK